LIAASLATALARAQSQVGYVGVGAGSSNASFNSSDFSLGLPQVTESKTDTSTGWKVFAGIRFNETFGAEVGYADLGKFTYKYNGGGAGSAALDYKVSGFSVSGVAIFPMFAELSLFGRVGAFGSTAKISLASATGNIATSLANAGITAGSGASASKTTLYFGGGAQIDFARQFSARFEYENYGEVGDSNDTGRATVSLFSASLLFRF
jgi:opacity protein-like surface antigen